MGFMLPSESTSPTERARALIKKKDEIEAEIQEHVAILKANGSTLNSPLVDPEGFPRADIDVFAVRTARVRIIELRNDLKDIIDAIGKALEDVYDPSLVAASQSSRPSNGSSLEDAPLRPFARIDGVVPGSPAADAGLRREDLVVKFGRLDSRSFTSSSLQPLAELVAENENQYISLQVKRSGENKVLSLMPRTGWGGRGLLGCHIVPYSSPAST